MVSKKIKKENTEDVLDEDVVFDEDVHLADKAKKLKIKLDKCKKESKENLLGWQRVLADFANAKKDNETRVKEASSFAKASLIEEVLPALDSFDMAFSDKKAWESVDKNWRIGVEYIHSQFISIFERNGLVQIDPKEGEKFDSMYHMSVGTENSNEDEKDKIMNVRQKGYKLNDKVIRPAKVVVSS